MNGRVVPHPFSRRFADVKCCGHLASSYREPRLTRNVTLITLVRMTLCKLQWWRTESVDTVRTRPSSVLTALTCEIVFMAAVVLFAMIHWA